MELWDKDISVSLKGSYLCTKVFGSYMSKFKRGSIINVSSICAAKGFPGLTVYSATKGALNAFTRSLAREVGKAKEQLEIRLSTIFSLSWIAFSL